MCVEIERCKITLQLNRINRNVEFLSLHFNRYFHHMKYDRRHKTNEILINWNLLLQLCGVCFIFVQGSMW